MKNVVDYENAIVLHLMCVVLHMLSYYNLKLKMFPRTNGRLS